MGRSGFSRIGLFLIVAAVVLASVGGAAAGLGAPTWLAGAVGAATALVAAVIVDRAFGARDDKEAALEARAQILDALRPEDVSAETKDAAADPLALLRADRSPMPFRARSKEMRRLDAWRDDADGSSVVLLSGSAGVGKSRLALEFASRAPEGWAAGWLHAGAGDTAIAAAAACREPAVILVDDADGRGDIVPLLDSLAERRGGPLIRVVLVTRSAGGLRASLVARLEERHAGIATGAPTIELEPEGGIDDRTRWFAEAVRAFATALGKTQPTLPEVLPQGHIDASQPFVMIQAQALLAVLGTKDDPRGLSFSAVAEALMRHEERRWDALAKARDWGSGGPPSEALSERAVATLALLTPNSDAEAEEVLRRVPELRDASTERRYEIAAWVSALYPSAEGATPRIQPDVIGEWFVVSQLTGSPALADGLRRGLTDEQASRALGFLARAADWIEAAALMFGQFVGGDVRRQVRAAAQAALTGEAGRRMLDAAVADLITKASEWTLDELYELDRPIPDYVLLRTHAAIAAQIVTVFRALTAEDIAVRQADLAMALNNLGIRLSQLGRHQEALAATQEAVTIHRNLAADTTAARQANLAGALNNLGVRLGELGRYQEALAATEEAVTVFRALAAEDIAVRQADLAMALNNLGIRLSQLGRHQEALAASQEAVTIRRALAADTTAARQANLAGALDNLGVRLGELGRYQEALAVGQEAVTVFRALAAKNIAAYQVGLAAALDNLGGGLHELGRYQEALAVMDDAVALRRALAMDNPAAHQAPLAITLDHLGILLDRLGRYQEALDATEEAVTAYRALAADNPDAHQDHLAMALNNLGIRLDRLGRHQEALDATEEAVTAYRTLAADNPAVHQAHLVAALDNLGIGLDGLGRHREALDAQTEAVSVYRQMAERDPELYGAEYRRKDGALRRKYEQRGMQLKAITHDLKASGSSGDVQP